MDSDQYYDDYWEKRITTDSGKEKIHRRTPRPLLKFSYFGAVMMQIPLLANLLDLGCGDGSVGSLFINKRKCNVVGIDVSRRAICIAKERGLHVINSDLTMYHLPIKDETFEVVTLIDVLEHTPSPLDLLVETRRVLVPGGSVLVLTPNFARIANRFRMLTGDPRDLLHWDRKYGDGKEHLQWFTVPKLRSYLRSCGFENVRLVPVGLNPPWEFLLGLLHLFGWCRTIVIRGTKP